MIKRLRLFFWLLLSIPVISCSQETNKNIFPVNDWAHVLDTAQIKSLEDELKSLEDSIGSQIVVLIIDSLGNESIEAYSLKIATEWGIGRKDFDDGILITLSMFDRKMRIEVGIGLERIIKDEIAAKIMREEMTPSFKEEKYYEGLLAAIIQIKTFIYDNQELIGKSH